MRWKPFHAHIAVLIVAKPAAIVPAMLDTG
jgi:hypothetical protein